MTSMPIAIPNSYKFSIIPEHLNYYSILPKKIDRFGNTLFHHLIVYAKKENCPELILQYLKNGGNIHARNYKGETPLHWIISEFPECLETVLHYLDDIDKLEFTYNKDSETILHKAVLHKQVKNVKIILEYCPDLAIDFDKRHYIWHYFDEISEQIKKLLIESLNLLH